MSRHECDCGLVYAHPDLVNDCANRRHGVSAQPWRISVSQTGTHLMHDNYCVARLDARDPKRITEALNPHLVPLRDPVPDLVDALRAVRAAAKAAADTEDSQPIDLALFRAIEKRAAAALEGL